MVDLAALFEHGGIDTVNGDAAVARVGRKFADRVVHKLHLDLGQNHMLHVIEKLTGRLALHILSLQSFGLVRRNIREHLHKHLVEGPEELNTFGLDALRQLFDLLVLEGHIVDCKVLSRVEVINRFIGGLELLVHLTEKLLVTIDWELLE